MDIHGEVGKITRYKLASHKKNFYHTVKYDSSNDTVIFSCKKFEFEGILCSLILKVLSSRGITKIPSQCILSRWTKYAKIGMPLTSTCEKKKVDDSKENTGRRYRELCRMQTQIAIKVVETEEADKIASSGLNI